MNPGREEVEQKVNRLLVEEFEISREDLTPEGKLFEDYELDSLDAIDILLGLERLFDVRLSEQQRNRSKEIRLVKDLYNFVYSVVTAS
ncbi:MAG: phosphopantetheine-binding protein [Pseudomonadota bacterium]